LRFRYTVLLACVSSLLWNALMIYLGMMFGSHWQRVNDYLNLYGKIFIPVLIVLTLGWFAYKYIKNRKEKKTVDKL
jgi:membrane protein DedA with SNARE-associated domain